MSTEVEIPDAEAFQDAMARIRSDEDPCNWGLFGHCDGNPNQLKAINCGSEGLEEMVDSLLDGEMQYALVRVQEEFDLSTTIKFVYIRWSGCNVPFARRGKYGVVQGSIESHFTPYHSSIETDSPDDLTTDAVMSKVQEQSGSKSKVLEAAEAKTRPERGFTSGTTTKTDSTGATPTKSSQMKNVGKMGSSFTGMTGMAKSSGGMRTSEEVADVIKAVRDDGNDTIWCTVAYEKNDPKKTLVVENTGSSQDDFPDQFRGDSTILYGLIRVNDVVDGIDTVKFVYVQWLGENVKPMSKAKVSTHKGALENQFKPFHVSIFATIQSEVSLRVILDKVSSASGSKINIKT